MHRTVLVILIVGTATSANGQEPDWEQLGFELELIAKSEVRRELQLDKGRKPELFGKEAFRAAAEKAIEGLKPGSREYMEALRTAMVATKPRRLTPLDIVSLTGEQLERLEELTYQWRFARLPWRTLRDAGILNGMGKGQDKLLELEHERDKELAKLIDEHRKETRKLLLERLAPERQEKWKAMTGKEFEFKAQPYELKVSPPAQVPREFRRPQATPSRTVPTKQPTTQQQPEHHP